MVEASFRSGWVRMRLLLWRGLETGHNRRAQAKNRFLANRQK